MLGSRSLPGVDFKTGFHEWLKIRFGGKWVFGQLLRELHQIDVLHGKRSPFVDEFVCENTDAPYVELFVLRLFESNFRGKIVSGATHGDPLFIAPEESSEAEITEEDPGPFDKEVFGLDVSVKGFLRVDVMKRREELLKNLDYFGVVEGLFLHFLEESAFGNELEDDVHRVVFDEASVQLDDVGMVEGRVNVDFSRQVPLFRQGGLPQLHLFTSLF